MMNGLQDGCGPGSEKGVCLCTYLMGDGLGG